MSQNTTITVTFINADGSGFPEPIQVLAGTTIGDFFRQRKPGENPNNFNIMVRRNGERLQLPAGDMLLNGDQVAVLHSKREGANV